MAEERSAMASGSTNTVRSLIRSSASRNGNMLISMQSCRLRENLEILNNKISKLLEGTEFWQHLRGLCAILQCLLTHVNFGEFGNFQSRVNSYMEFEEAFDLYIGYCTVGQRRDHDVKKRLKELLLHPEVGLCVYIVRINGCQVIVLRADDIDLEDFYSCISLESSTDLPTSRITLDKNNVKALMKTLDSEWDKKVLRVVLGATRSRSQLDYIGIDSDSICKDTEDVFGYLEKLESVEKEANSIVCENIQNRIKKKENDLKTIENMLSRKERIWESHQVEDCKTEIDDLREKLFNVQSLKLLLNDDSTHNPKKKRMINRCRSNIIRERRLKLRNHGSGRKSLMDEVDERFLLECIMSKATAHG